MDPRKRAQIHDWMASFADGDRDAFQPLFSALWPILLAFATRGLGVQSDAEDAAQQTVMKVFSRIVDFDRSRDGLSWALGIAGFEVLTVRKQRLRRREAGPTPLVSFTAEGADLEERAIAEELRQAVRDVVGELSERDQQALAHVLAGTASPMDERSRKQRFRALERLRAAWRRVHG
jgi:RNA polymerase sigma-70 factor (ECF subfamily)